MIDEGKAAYEFDSFRLVPSERQLLREGQPVALPPKAFDTLLILVQNSGHALKKEDLLKQVWPGSFVEECNLNHYISLLRKSLSNGSEEDYVETIRGYGFRFNADVRRINSDPNVLLRRQTRTHVVFKQQESETIRTVNATLIAPKPKGRALAISALILFVAGALGSYFWFIRPAEIRNSSSASAASAAGIKRGTENAEAYQAYLNGRHYWNKRTPDNSLKAAEYFQRAIELDPNFALAYVGLADAYNYFPLRQDQKATLARAALEKALALDDSIAEAHATLGNLSLFNEWDWAEAERSLQRAIELDPNYPTAHHWYAYYLAAMGDLEGAIGAIRRARDLDPLSLIINTDVGQLLHYARRDDEAIEELRRTIEMDRDFVMAHHRLAEVYERRGRFAEAVAEFQKAYPGYRTHLREMAIVARVYAVSGNQSEARRMLALIERAPKGERDMVAKLNMALIHAGLGEKDQAFAWLEKAFAEKDVELILLKSNPLFDSLRPDPRFQDLLHRMNLPQS